MSNRKAMICLIILVGAVLSVYTHSPIINSDSVSGFEAMNGYHWTGKFNTTLVYEPGTPILQEHFLTWWSPGQYLAPWIFMKVFHLKLGGAVVLVNFICLVIGAIGFMLVFEKFGFSRVVNNISVALIMFSGVTLQRYYIYQGGESLNFVIFPWIILMQPLFKRKYGGFILPGVVVLAAFLFKLQLLIIVPPLIFLLIIMDLPQKSLKDIIIACIPLAVSSLIAVGLIYWGFMSKGATPAASTNHISFNPLNFLVPVASPLTSISFFGLAYDGLHARMGLQVAYLLILSLVVAVIILRFVRDLPEDDEQRRKYKFMVGVLYLFCVVAFFLLYTKGSNIDYGTRHYKLTSFLFYPLGIDWLFRRAGRKLTIGLASLFVLIATANHFRLTRTWLSNTSVTSSGFLLSLDDMPLPLKEKLDNVIKTKTIVVSRYEPRYAIDNALILPVQRLESDSSHIVGPGGPILYLDSLKRP